MLSINDFFAEQDGMMICILFFPEYFACTELPFSYLATTVILLRDCYPNYPFTVTLELMRTRREFKIFVCDGCHIDTHLGGLQLDPMKRRVRVYQFLKTARIRVIGSELQFIFYRIGARSKILYARTA
jgi:hypothetical protein